MPKGKLITITSPKTQVGKTTITNALGAQLAKKGLTLIIELDKTSSFTPFLQGNLNENKKSLSNTMLNASKLYQNVQEAKTKNLYYLCKLLTDDINDLYSFNPTNIDKIVSNAIEKFDYIILDIPTDVLNPATARVYTEDFAVPVSLNLVVIDENAHTLKLLNDYNHFYTINKVMSETRNILLINKSKYLFRDYINTLANTMQSYKFKGIVDIPYVEDLNYKINRGEFFIKDSKDTKNFFNAIESIYEYILNPNKSLPVNLKPFEEKSEDENTEKKGLFSRKPKQPKEKPYKKEKPTKEKKQKPEKPIKNKKPLISLKKKQPPNEEIEESFEDDMNELMSKPKKKTLFTRKDKRESEVEEVDE